MRILIRADASQQIGTGHVMRCLTLADDLLELGLSEIILACRHLPEWLEKIAEQRRIKVARLGTPASNKDAAFINECAVGARSMTGYLSWLGVSQEVDAAETLALAQANNADWIIVDHYALDSAWEKVVRGGNRRIFVIDDLANRAHDCDILLDQNFYKSADKRYLHLAPKTCRTLLGPRFALIHRDYREQRASRIQHKGKINHILVCFGGADAHGETLKALQALKKTKPDSVSVEIVTGALNPHEKSIQALASEMSHTSCHRQVSSLAPLMAKADLAIGAGGVTTWERCALGLPSIAAAIAENQVELLSDMAEAGNIIYLGESAETTADHYAQALADLWSSPGRVQRLSQASAALTDAKGALRAARALYTHDIQLRRVVSQDCERIFEWRNDEQTRRHSFDSSVLSFENHRSWFEATLTNSTRALLIGTLRGKEVGVLRFDKNGVEALVSIYLVPGMHGQGLGPSLLHAGAQWIGRNAPEIGQLRAEIAPGNEASISAFNEVGFKQTAGAYLKQL